MPAVSLQSNWGCASLAITLTTAEFDFFIQLNLARGKTKEKYEKMDVKGQKFRQTPQFSGEKKQETFTFFRICDGIKPKVHSLTHSLTGTSVIFIY